jgi:hypothetical protein
VLTATDTLKANAVLNYRVPCLKVSFQWDGENWTDEGAYVLAWERTIESARVESGAAIFGSAVAGKASITLDNTTNRFSQYATGGAIYDYISNGKFQRMPVKIEAGFVDTGAGAEYLTQFVGFVVNITEDATEKTVTLYCEDQSVELRNRRLSTSVVAGKSAGEWVEIVTGCVNDSLTAESRANIPYSVDEGRFAYDFLWMEDDYVWDEFNRLAEADGGRFYFCPSGSLRYEDPTHLLLDTTSRHTFTTAKFANLTHQWQWQQPPVNHVIVRYRPRYIAAYEVIYRASEVLVIKPGETLNHKAEFSNAVWAIVDPVASVDYVAINAARQDCTSDLTVGTLTEYAKSATIPLTNGNTYETLYVTRLQLRGYPIGFRDVDSIEKTNTTSIAQYGKTTRTVSNPYIMSYRHADAIGQFTIDREKDPKQVIGLRGIPAIPWLEVSDRITVVEADSGTNVDAYILRETQGMSFMNPQDAKYYQHIDALPVTSLYPYSDYFQIGVTALGVPSQEMLVNGTFESVSGSNFGSWAEVADGDGHVDDETSLTQEGDHAVMLVASGSSNNTQVNQSADVVAGLSYTLVMYTAGDGTNDGQYQVYDVTNSANIVETKGTEITGSNYTAITETFSAPAGCKVARTILRCPAAAGSAYFDSVSLVRATAGGRLFY